VSGKPRLVWQSKAGTARSSGLAEATRRTFEAGTQVDDQWRDFVLKGDAGLERDFTLARDICSLLTMHIAALRYHPPTSTRYRPDSATSDNRARRPGFMARTVRRSGLRNQLGWVGR